MSARARCRCTAGVRIVKTARFIHENSSPTKPVRGTSLSQLNPCAYPLSTATPSGVQLATSGSTGAPRHAVRTSGKTCTSRLPPRSKDGALFHADSSSMNGRQLARICEHLLVMARFYT
ncbi:hypothetical protein MRX96_021868 [Rhipicephalus microplus]